MAPAWAPAAFSLARASGRSTSLLISVAILVAHVLFGYAQISGIDSDCPGIGSTSDACPTGLPNDGLVEIVLEASVEYDAKGSLASTLGFVEDAVCGSPCPGGAPGAADSGSGVCDSLTCGTCLAVGSLGFEQACTLDLSRPVMHMSYIYMLRELFYRDECPDCYHGTEACCTGIHPGRAAAYILVFSSFVWPHIKLLLLHLFLYLPLTPSRRRNRNYWLAFFGKWTLSDVLVWCSCIGVFQGLAVHDSLLGLWAKVEGDATFLCDLLCANHTHLQNTTCSHLCAMVDGALDAALLNPKVLPSSSVDVQLGFRTRIGTYLFCLAVVLSLSISVLIDALEDARLEKETTAAATAATPAQQLLDADAPPSDEYTTNTRGGGGWRSRSPRKTPWWRGSSQSGGLLSSSPPPRLASCTLPCVLHTAGVTLYLCLLAGAVTLPLFRRVVNGGVPAALRVRGFDFDGAFSCVDLARLAAGPGGFDYLLSATFWAFIIICPLLRGVTLFVLLVCPLPLRTARRLHRASRSLSYYYAHEVILLAVPLLQITIGPLTSTLFTPSVTPICGTLDQLYDQPACLQIEVLPAIGYILVAVSFAVFLCTGFDGSPTHKFVHRALFPSDAPPPTLPPWECCTPKCRAPIRPAAAASRTVQ